MDDFTFTPPPQHEEGKSIFNITPAQYLAHEKELTKSQHYFEVQKANQCIEDARQMPIPQMLFSEFWFEHELCFMYADSNAGKSILGVQIAESISRGQAIPGFMLQSKAQPVLYFDFELGKKQFENRYSVNYDTHHTFSDNFYRGSLNPYCETPEGYTDEEYMIICLEETLLQYNIKVAIIDNLTYLKNETEKAKDALLLMKHLKALKEKHCLSLMVMAHTPKRDPYKPFTRNDLSGSKMLMNFCDSAFAVGESHLEPELRYLKQIKVRACEKIYHECNVAVCRLTKPLNFLQFQFLEYGYEQRHLKQLSEDDRKEKMEAVKELSERGLTQRQIAEQLDISTSTVNKYLKA